VLRGDASPEQLSREALAAPQRRLADALAGRGPVAAGPADRAVLLRHVLRAHDESLAASLGDAVSVAPVWGLPDAAALREFGFGAHEEVDGTIRLRAHRWRPEWLPNSTRHSVDEDAFALPPRRGFHPVSGDPCLQLAGRAAYLCSGQREAVRAVLTAPPGATLVVNLPTGGGKSLCAHLPALLGAEQGKLTIVVVPTVALALDQARSLADLVPYPCAYAGGRDDASRERNRAIRRRIADGTQGIVFAAPESVCGALSTLLTDTVRRGALHALVVDEAHLVDQWGDEFRTAFQEVAALRQVLLEASSPDERFRTLLLSATLTAPALSTLHALFNAPGPFEVVAAAQLRPEPSFWFSRAPDGGSKCRRILEALRRLPRPLILYTSRRDDARHWAELLRAEGYRRLGMVTGETRPEERARVVERWARDEIDLVVATSAFGMGVDKADVRAVVHACVPESVDRFYQEVGRGGRDGAACVALTVYDAGDLALARRMGRRRIIGPGRGSERWERIFESKVPAGSGTVRVSLDAFPSYRMEDIDMRGAWNRVWNLRTLTLLQRAGVLELLPDPPPQPDPERETEDTDAAYERALDEWRAHRRIRIHHDDHLLPEHWAARVEPVRRRSTKADWRSVTLMDEALRGTRCLSAIFSELYRIGPGEIYPGSRAVPVAEACGGCPACRRAGRAPFCAPMPVPRFPWLGARAASAAVQELVDAPGSVVLYPANRAVAETRRHRRELLQWLVSGGVRNVVAPETFRDELRDLGRAPGSFTFFSALEEAQPILLPRVPSVVVFPPGEPVHGGFLPTGGGPPRVVLVPDDARDPDKPHCLLRDTMRTRNYTMDELRVKVGL